MLTCGVAAGQNAIRPARRAAQIMDLVELQPLAQALVGRPGSSGLSVEQRKRLTIAVELVRAAFTHSGGSRALPRLSNKLECTSGCLRLSGLAQLTSCHLKWRAAACMLRSSGVAEREGCIAKDADTGRQLLKHDGVAGADIVLADMVQVANPSIVFMDEPTSGAHTPASVEPVA